MNQALNSLHTREPVIRRIRTSDGPAEILWSRPRLSKFSEADPAARALEQREADTRPGRKMVHIRCTHSPAGRDTTDDCRRSPVSPSIVQEQTKHESDWFVAV